MKRLVLLLILFSSIDSVAQQQPALPKDLPALVALLPSLVHGKQYDAASYTDAFWSELKANPSSAEALIPVISKNLEDPDQDVQFDTIVLLHGIALVRPDFPQLLTPLYPQ